MISFSIPPDCGSNISIFDGDGVIKLFPITRYATQTSPPSDALRRPPLLSGKAPLRRGGAPENCGFLPSPGAFFAPGEGPGVRSSATKSELCVFALNLQA